MTAPALPAAGASETERPSDTPLPAARRDRSASRGGLPRLSRISGCARRLCAGLLVLTGLSAGLLAGAGEARAQSSAIFSATMTVELDNVDFTGLGYNTGGDSGSLSPGNTFSHGGASFTVRTLNYYSSLGLVRTFSWTGTPTFGSAYALCLDGALAFTGTGAQMFGTSGAFQSAAFTDPSWSVSDTVDVKLYEGSTCPTAAPSLDASAITDSTATLTLSGHTGAWWYKQTSPTGSTQDLSCKSIVAGTSAVQLSGLTPLVGYSYKAYSASGCMSANELANETFTMLARVTTPGTTVWSGKLTAGDIGSGIYGFVDGFFSDTGSLDTTTFSYGGAQFSVSQISLAPTEVKGGFVKTSGTPTYGSAYSLCYDGTKALSYGSSGFEGVQAGTPPAGISQWSTGTKVDVKLVTGTTCPSTTTPTTAPEIDVQGNGVSIADNDSSPSTADHTDFGAADVSGGTVERTFTIKNLGSGALTLSGTPNKVAVSGTNAADFTVKTQPASSVAATTGSTTFTVTFDPSDSGERTATLTIANNDANEGTYNFDIKGSGTAATLTASNVRGTSATLTIANLTGGWWYKRTTPASNTCVSVPSGTTASLSSLTAGTEYTYKAYSATGCADAAELADETFTTAKAAVSDIAQTTATLTVTDHPSPWRYQRTTPSGGTCTLVSSGATASLVGLSPGASYTFTTYQGSSCTTANKVTEVRFSAATATNTPATGEPTITGTPQVGQVLTADKGTIADGNGLPSTLNYRWIRVDGSTNTDISGSAGSGKTYTVVQGDVGKTLKVRVSFTDNGGNAEMRTSAATAAVTAQLALGAVSNQSWEQGHAVDVTLPEATGGTGTKTYTLEGTLPAGVSFDGTTRKLSGTPTALASRRSLTYRVTDSASVTASHSFTAQVVRDTTRPTLVSVAGDSATGGTSPKVNPFGLLVTVSEPVCFDLGEFTVDGGSAAARTTETVTCGGTSVTTAEGTKTDAGWVYAFDVRPGIAVGRSTVEVEVTADALIDRAGNAGTGGDRTVIFSADIAAVLTLLKPVDKIFVKDEAVPTTGAIARKDDLRAATGGTPPYTYTLEGTVPTGLSLDTSGTVPKLAGTPTAAGTTTVTLKVTDSATPTAGTVTQSFSVTVAARPTVTIGVDDTALAIGEEAEVTLTFSEPVGTVDPGFIADCGTGCTVPSTAAFTGNAAKTVWTKTLKPPTSGHGTIELRYSKDAVKGNTNDVGNAQAENVDVTWDTRRTKPAITVDKTALKNGETATVTVTFMEAVTGVDDGELTASTGTLSTLAGTTSGANKDKVWTATLTPPADEEGTINLNMAADAATSVATGNGNAKADTLEVAYDTLKPTATIAVAGGGLEGDNRLNKGETTTVTVTYSETVTRVETGLATSTGTLTRVGSGSTGTVFTYTLAPPATLSGTITLSHGADQAEDDAGNGNTAATPVTVNYDNTVLSAPAGVEVAPGDVEPATQIKVTWNAVTDATGYAVEWKGGSQTSWTAARTTISSLSATITGLSTGVVYSVRVAATKAEFDDSPWSESEGSPYDGPLDIRLSKTAVTVCEGTTNCPGQANTYTVRLNKPPEGSSVTVKLLEHSRRLSVSPRTLTFTASTWSTPQTVTATGTRDDIAWGEDGMTTEIRHLRSGGGRKTGISRQKVTATIHDDDTASVVVSTDTLTLAEDGSATYTISITSQPREREYVQVKASVWSGGKRVYANTPGVPAVANGGSFSNISRFTAEDWRTPRIVTVSGVKDNRTGDRTATVKHVAQAGSYFGLPVADVALNVTNVETYLLHMLYNHDIVAPGKWASSFMRMYPQPTSDVTLTLKSSDTSVAVVDMDRGKPGDQRTITLTSNNHNQRNLVRVRGVGDASDAAYDQPATITVESVSDTAFNSLVGAVVGTVRVCTGGNYKGGVANCPQDGPSQGEPEERTPGLNSPPLFAADAENRSATVGTAFSYTVPEAEDAEDDAIVYTAELIDGGDLPEWLAFDAETRTFSGTPGVGDALAEYEILVLATDDGEPPLFEGTEFTLTVAAADGEEPDPGANIAPSFAATPADQAAAAGTAFSYQVPAATDSNDDTVTYTAALADGSTLDGSAVTEWPAWLSFDASTRTLSGTPGAGDAPAALTVAVTATDDGSPALSTTTRFKLTVAAEAGANIAPSFAATPGDQSATGGTAFSYQVPAATDPEDGTLTYTAALFDGSTLDGSALTEWPDWLSFDASTRTLSGTPGADDAPAELKIAVTATDDGSPAGSATVRFALTVAAAGPAACVTPVTVGAVPVVLNDEPWNAPDCKAHHRADRPARYFSFTLAEAAVLTLGVVSDETAALFVSKGTPANGWGTPAKAGMEHRLTVRRANGKLVHGPELTASPLALTAGSYTIEAVLAEDPDTDGTPEFDLAAFVQTPAKTVSVADAQTTEGAGPMAFAVTLDGPAPAGGVSVGYATSDGTAVAGSDYAAASGTLTFAFGETAKTVSVAILDDAHDDDGETFTLTLSNPTGVTLGDASATGTIANDDPLLSAWLARFGRSVASQTVQALAERFAVPRGSGSHVTLGGQRIGLSSTGQAPGPDGTALGSARKPGAGGGPDGTGTQSGTAGPIPGGDDAFAALAAAGGSGSDLHRGHGHGFASTAIPGSPGGAQSRGMTGRELLLGSSFHLALGAGEGAGGQSGAGSGEAGRWTLWGRAGLENFSGKDGGLSVDGEVVTGVFGADRESGRWLAGVALTHSTGDGTARQGEAAYDLESTVTAVNPYLRLALSDRMTAWGMVGYGLGGVKVVKKGETPERYRTDLEMTLGAFGGRAALLRPAENGGFGLALKGDAFFVSTETDKASASGGVGNLAAAEGEASRMRVGLEGSHALALEGGSTLTPSLELGLRHDGGDAETGTGIEVGGGLAWSDPSSGVSADLKARTLVAHAESGYREWGVSGAVRIAPGERGRGLSLSLAPAFGADAGQRDRVWAARDAAELVPGVEAEATLRLDAELGFGLPVHGERFTGTPYAGFGYTDTERRYRLGWRLTPGASAGAFTFSLEASRRETANPGSGSGAGSRAEHGIGFRLNARW